MAQASSIARSDFLVFGAPLIERDEIEEVIASLRSGWIGTGPKVVRFESDFAKFKGIAEQQVAAVNSCTAALHLFLSSGIAGSMVANKGLSNLQGGTIRNILIAWLLTLPVCIFLSLGLFFAFRMII